MAKLTFPQVESLRRMVRQELSTIAHPCAFSPAVRVPKATARILLYEGFVVSIPNHGFALTPAGRALVLGLRTAHHESLLADALRAKITDSARNFGIDPENHAWRPFLDGLVANLDLSKEGA